VALRQKAIVVRTTFVILNGVKDLAHSDKMNEKQLRIGAFR
jgi:hypothetical protein